MGGKENQSVVISSHARRAGDLIDADMAETPNNTGVARSLRSERIPVSCGECRRRKQRVSISRTVLLLSWTYSLSLDLLC